MITKIVKGKNSLKFQIKGDYDVCVINAIRRITSLIFRHSLFRENQSFFRQIKPSIMRIFCRCDLVSFL